MYSLALVNLSPCLFCYIPPGRKQLFGYDVLVDETLRPWLLEVNASPSLGASNREDLRLKKQMVGDALDIVDVEGRQGTCLFPRAKRRETRLDTAWHMAACELQAVYVVVLV